jgi:hypothetical protein
MSTLLRAASTVNSSPAPSAVAAIAWHALLKTADKEACRDDLEAGSTHIVNLNVAGDIDGQAFDQHITAVLAVGHESTRATSATPSVDRVIASILAKLNEATREAILRDLPEVYAANGCELPEVPAAIAEKTSAMLQRLRAKKQIDVRGSVSVKYSLGEVESGNGGLATAGC